MVYSCVNIYIVYNDVEYTLQLAPPLPICLNSGLILSFSPMDKLQFLPVEFGPVFKLGLTFPVYLNFFYL